MKRALVAFGGLAVLWVVLALTMKPARLAGYQILGRDSGSGQVTLWVQVSPGARADEIQAIGADLQGRFSDRAKSFVIAFYDGPKTDDASHVIGSYSDGRFYDTRDQ